ncbi:MAG: hypothetical protein KDM64_13205, partial [Verrucomicrobiae bacterium]|nr:hypothetical protein [Verrucomicrobiae bacterium]
RAERLSLQRGTRQGGGAEALTDLTLSSRRPDPVASIFTLQSIPKVMRNFLRERPWIWVVVAFVFLFSAWTTLFTIALRNQPEKVPLEHLQASETAR